MNDFENKVQVIKDIAYDIKDIDNPRDFGIVVNKHLPELKEAFDADEVKEILEKELGVKYNLIVSISELKSALDEIIIRFDKNPHYYTKLDFGKLVFTIAGSLLYLYSLNTESVIDSEWAHPDSDKYVSSEKLVYTSLQAEKEERENRDDELEDMIESFESELEEEIQDEISDRKTAVKTVDDKVTTLTTRITTAEENIDTLTDNLDLEIERSLNAETLITSNLNTEISARLNGDGELRTDLESEVTDRTTADNNLKDQIDALKSRGKFLALWDCTTGLPETFPSTLPYTYSTGDYYIVSAVGTTNYKPDGLQYTGEASTVVETSTATVNDTYYFDGSIWKIQTGALREVGFSEITGDPYDNTNLSIALDEKANDVDLTTHISNTNNPHFVTAAQIGLGNVDNTHDIDKPISTATQTALDEKADSATTLAGYNIEDAKIEDGTITLGTNTITPLTEFVETDPVFTASAAHEIQSSDIDNWNSKLDPKTTLDGYGIIDAKIVGNTITLGNNTITPLTEFTETDPIYSASVAASITSTDINNWNNKQDAITDGSATIASVLNNIVTLKAGVTLSEGSISNNSAADVTLSKVAKTGSYNDLSDLPVIPGVPTNLSEFTDDLGSSPVHTHSLYLTSYTETDPTVPDWAKQSTKPSYTAAEVGAYTTTQVDTLLTEKLDTISDLETIRSGAALGATALQSETDPTVPDWAKTITKPSYTADEVGAYTKEEVDTELAKKQDKLTAGTNIQIVNNTISATDTVYDDTAVRALITANTNAITTETTNRENADDDLQDQIDDLKARGKFLSLWNCITGKPTTDPATLPYTYNTGDYYIVSTVSSGATTYYRHALSIEGITKASSYNYNTQFNLINSEATAYTTVPDVGDALLAAGYSERVALDATGLCGTTTIEKVSGSTVDSEICLSYLDEGLVSLIDSATTSTSFNDTVTQVYKHTVHITGTTDTTGTYTGTYDITFDFYSPDTTAYTTISQIATAIGVDTKIATTSGSLVTTEETFEVPYVIQWEDSESNKILGLCDSSYSKLALTTTTHESLSDTTSGGGTNYRPDGTSYTGAASTTIESATVSINDTYYYDGSVWKLQTDSQKTVSFSSVAGSPYDNTNLTTVLNTKANSDDLATVATSGSYNDLSNKPEIPSLAGYATELWVEDKGYLTEHQSLENYVTTNTALDITATKTFAGAKVAFQPQSNTNISIDSAADTYSDTLKLTAGNTTGTNPGSTELLVFYNYNSGRKVVRPSINSDGSSGVELGSENNKYWKLWLASQLTDGTNSITVQLMVNKVDKETGKGLSTNDYTAAEKTKLAGIAAGAQVNVLSDWNEDDPDSDAYILNKPTIVTYSEGSNIDIDSDNKINALGYTYGSTDNTFQVNAATATGSRSFACNLGKATGSRSAAFGGGEAIGTKTVAEGSSNAIGENSHSEGEGTVSCGEGSHVEGAYAHAHGTTSHAEGYYTCAKGNGSHAEGWTNATDYIIESGVTITSASGASTTIMEVITENDISTVFNVHIWMTSTSAWADHYFLVNTVVLDSTDPTKYTITFCENLVITYTSATPLKIKAICGTLTIASGIVSHAEGVCNLALAEGSHVEGFYTIANGDYSHAEGACTITNGAYSHAEGLHTTTNADYQLVCGSFNESDTNSRFVVGNGTSSDSKSNAFTVGTNGNTWSQTDVYCGGTNTVPTHKLSEKANATHTHAISDVTDLQTTLDEKVKSDDTYSSAITTMMRLTLAEYDAITTKDANTFYIIVG